MQTSYDNEKTSCERSKKKSNICNTMINCKTNMFTREDFWYFRGFFKFKSKQKFTKENFSICLL